jgi:hypothetical protein
MDPEYDTEQAMTLLQAAIKKHAGRKDEKTKAIDMINVSIKHILEIYEQLALIVVTGRRL